MDPLAESDPRQLGPYKIIARLGSGGMGVVFLGSQGSQRVAVKVMRSSFLDSPTLKTRFEREIATLKKIKSPFVAKYLDSDIEGDLAWHAVEFVNGPTLKEKIENDGPLNEDAWWVLYSQMREALNDVHRAGVVHRDLKPANIILSETGLKLIDFGISQDSEATSLTSTGMVAGSPAWLSPEQLEGGEVGPASDLFSAGSILTYAALGRSPWGKETTMTVPVAYKKILSLDFDLDGLRSSYKDAVSPLLLEKASERSFPDLSRTGKSEDQDETDEPKKSLAGEQKQPVDTGVLAASKASTPNLRMRTRVGVGFMIAVILGVASLFVFARSPLSIFSILDNGTDLATVSKPQSSEGRSLPLRLEIYADSTETTTVVRAYPPSKTSYFMLKIEGAEEFCDTNTLSSVDNTGYSEIECLLIPDQLDLAILGYRLGSDPESFTFQLTEGGYVSSPDFFASATECQSPRQAVGEDIRILGPTTSEGDVVELSLELVSPANACWGDLEEVFAGVEDLRVAWAEGFYGGLWSPDPCEIGDFVGGSKYGYGAFFALEKDDRSENIRFVLRCRDNLGALDPWPLEVTFEAHFSELEYPQRFFIPSELDFVRF